ncbi:hypothetical protein [Nostoc sp.]|uniref:hypothetical protein n=1 Tax=Nostoc sp. TaxID=1180 RepID=UPI002FF139DD
MARKPRESDLLPGKHVHYWGQNWQVWSNDGKVLVLVIPGYSPGQQYQPYPAGMYFNAFTQCQVDDDCLWCFDEIKKDIFGRELK